MGLAGRAAERGLVMMAGMQQPLVARRLVTAVPALVPALVTALFPILCTGAGQKKSIPRFQTSDRCLACHNGLATPSGEDVSIGFAWRASIMANSSRDPYWQASVRRESIDHPESQSGIEDECSVCHMPITRYEAKLDGKAGQVFSHLPFSSDDKHGREAQDGVSCSVCHQIGKQKLGTRESFTGGFVVDAPSTKNQHPEYGPFEIEQGQKRIMQTSSNGFVPTDEQHIRDSELCATCHTLFTEARGPGGRVIGELPEQMPYLEWLHSDYKQKQSCQYCHMPEVKEATPITKVLGVPREGMHRHTFVAANFFMQNMLNRYRGELEVTALPHELTAAAHGTAAFLETQAARIKIDQAELVSNRLEIGVSVENLGGHKLPTAYPSRRAWLHVLVRDRNGRLLFESGKLNADGSIQGNDNDADPSRFEPHYTEIERGDQVQIYESIMKDPAGRVTTGLLTAIGYLKDNRLLPHGFDKQTASKDIAVLGEAFNDADFTADGDRIGYLVDTANAPGPLKIDVELWYQPIGYRWANNLKAYHAADEPRRFNSYYDAMGGASAIVLAHASATK
jgi:hypothetical protein